MKISGHRPQSVFDRETITEKWHVRAAAKKRTPFSEHTNGSEPEERPRQQKQQ